MKLWQKTLNNSPISNGSATCSRSALSSRFRHCWPPQAHVNRNIAPEHQKFLSCLCRDKHDELIPEIRDFPAFTRVVLDWQPTDLLDLAHGEQAARRAGSGPAGV